MRMRVLKLATPKHKMASNANFRGEYDFVEKPSEEFFCPVTYEVLLDPVQTNLCCGNHLSRAVAEQLQAQRKPCPLCKKTPLKTGEDLFFKRKVRQLKVRCHNKSAGCRWVGELGELEGHLNLGSLEGQCDFVEGECPLKCGKILQRHNIEEHKSNDCAKRPFSCKYCDYESTHEKVVNDHWPKCQRFPEVCPNKCSTDTIERQFLQHHLQEQCPLQEIPCEFAFAGCQATVERKAIQKHLDENKDVHLRMTATECKNLKTKLADLTLAFNTMVTKPFFNPPPDIIMNEFERRRKESERLFSPAFYTHVGGYKMCLSIRANGWDTGKGTHVGVSVYMMKGEFDSHLKWPFKGEITVELVNQKEGRENYGMKPVQHTEGEEFDKVFQRVTKGERAATGCGYAEFISHADLYKPEKGKEFLLNDTLIFRVTKVEVTSV